MSYLHVTNSLRPIKSMSRLQSRTYITLMYVPHYACVTLAHSYNVYVPPHVVSPYTMTLMYVPHHVCVTRMHSYIVYVPPYVCVTRRNDPTYVPHYACVTLMHAYPVQVPPYVFVTLHYDIYVYATLCMYHAYACIHCVCATLRYNTMNRVAKTHRMTSIAGHFSQKSHQL